MSLATIRTAMETAVASVITSGVQINKYVPSNVAPPCIDFSLKQSNPIEFHKVGGAGDTVLLFDATVLVSMADRVDAQTKLDEFMMHGGAKSIRVALETMATGTDADTIIVKKVSHYGQIEYNGVNYLGAIFDVEVWASEV